MSRFNYYMDLLDHQLLLFHRCFQYEAAYLNLFYCALNMGNFSHVMSVSCLVLHLHWLNSCL